MTLHEIIGYISADISLPDYNPVIRQICTDSRTITEPGAALFFAIQQGNSNGSRFISKAIQDGAVAIITGDDLQLDSNMSVPLIRCSNALEALQHLAISLRHQMTEAFVIGITGSYGKTTIKSWMQQHYGEQLWTSPGSYNSQTGVPISVFEAYKVYQQGKIRAFMFEAGISLPREMKKLREMIRPDLAVLTNIGEAHLVNFSDRESLIQEKLQLLDEAPSVLVNLNDPDVAEAYRTIWSGLPRPEHQRGWHWINSSYGLIEGSVLSERGVLIAENSTDHVESPYFDPQNPLPLSNEAYAENIVNFRELCRVLSNSYDGIRADIPQDFSAFQPLPMRLETFPGQNATTVINDSWISDLLSLKAALDLLRSQTAYPRKTLIFSDLQQSHLKDSDWISRMAELIGDADVTRLICVGIKIQAQKHQFGLDHIVFYNTTELLIQAIKSGIETFSSEAILIKGARSFGFERIADMLRAEVHETSLSINITAMQRNINVYKSLLRPETQIIGMVKALAYGGGSYEIAQALIEKGISWLAVAYTDEGVDLRQKGITQKIMVMNPSTQGIPMMLRYNLEPVIYDMSYLHAFTEAVKQSDAIDKHLHLKLNTGMNRLGFNAADILELIEFIGNNTALIRMDSIFTHLVATEDPMHDKFTHTQIDLFHSIADQISGQLHYRPARHVLNSAGAVRFPEYQADAVRLGIGLYGIDPSEQLGGQLEHVAAYRTTVSQVHQLRAGDSVGYSRRGVADRDMRTATIALGYADGFRRSLGNGRFSVIIRGHECPTIGSVCMDMTMVILPDAVQISAGDEVIIFDARHPIHNIARAMDTIPYEVLTSISPRVRRIYWRE